MEDEYKGRGATRACTKCGWKIASQIKIFGFGSLHIFCRNPDCKSDEIISINYKPLITIASALAIVLIFGFGGYGKLTAKKLITCDMFDTYEQAKTLFDTDKVKFRSLDKNHNDLPCEELMR